VPHPINRSDDPARHHYDARPDTEWYLASSHILNSKYVTIWTVPKLRTEAWEKLTFESSAFNELKAKK
jgi:hypothetical protein